MIQISESARSRVRELIASKQQAGLYLRVFIQGGGCSGFQYGFQLEDGQEDGDLLVDTDGVRVIVDPLSMQYLEGSEIDFKNDLMGSRFVVHNPNATTTCGCGSSFAA